MAETSTTPAAAPAKFTPGTPAWVDSTSTDTEKSKAFYPALFGWTANDLGEEAGNYVMFELEGAIVGATGPVQGEGQPAAWSVYFATDDADETARKVEAAGGKVIFPPLEVMDQGKMAVFADSTGAFFSVWQSAQMPGLGRIGAPNTFGWCELNTRGVDKAAEFYKGVFGWNAHKPDNGEGAPPYTEWQLNGQSFGGGIDMADTGMPEGIPPHWLVYFATDDIDTLAAKVAELGGKVMLEPREYPGGKFAVVTDPVGASFGLMTPGK
ncbi:MAG TPA: VOC family protein [Candidatus Dormibacteraeota bacterium]|nr:VOC family protein [Candidatus Dormibacteraeota bacterium]